MKNGTKTEKQQEPLIRINIGKETMLVDPLALYFFANGIGTSQVLNAVLDEDEEELLLTGEEQLISGG